MNVVGVRRRGPLVKPNADCNRGLVVGIPQHHNAGFKAVFKPLAADVDWLSGITASLDSKRSFP